MIASAHRLRAGAIGRPVSRLLGCLALCLALGGCAGSAATAAAPALDGAVLVQAPAEVQAGAPAPVLLARPDAPDGLAASLVAQGSYGVRVYRAAFHKGQALFQIPGEDTRQAGLVTLIAQAGTARGHAQLRVLPGPPAEPLTPLVGPRAVIADGQHQAMVVAVPFDDYGNPMADGTPVEFRAQHPDGQIEQTTATVSHLVAWWSIASGTRAGHATLAASAGAAHGPDAGFDETPGWPVAFGLSASPAGVPADGHRLVTLRTEVIRDRFGNPMLDGTLVTFAAEMPDATRRFIPAYTIDGAAEAQLQAPATPGTATVRATLYGVESQPLALTFAPGPAVGVFALQAQVNARDGAVSLEAGPLLSALGQFVPDGTLVQFRLSGPDGSAQQASSSVLNGHARAELRLRDLQPGSYTAEAQAGSGHGSASFTVR